MEESGSEVEEQSGLNQSFESVKTSPNFISLKKLVQEIDAQKDLKLQLPPTKAAKLQLLKEKVVGEINENEVMPVIRQADHFLGQINQTSKLSKLEQENNQLKQEIDDLRDENSRISFLSSQNSVDNDEIASIHSQAKKSEQKLLQTISQLKQRINDLENDQIDKDAEIEHYQQINQNLTTENAKMENYIKKTNEKIQKYEDMIFDFDQQNQKLKKQIDDLKMQNEVLLHQTSENDGKMDIEIENEQLKQQIDDLVKFTDIQNQHCDQQSTQIQTLFNQRKNLSEIIYKLLQELEMMERVNVQQSLQQKPKEEVISRDIVPLIDPEKERETEKSILASLVSQIKEFIFEDQQAVEILSDSRISDEDKLFQVVEYLKKEKEMRKTQEALEARNQVLQKAVFSQLRFINELANSRELQKLMIQAPHTEMLRKMLQSSYSQCQQYLTENNIQSDFDERSCFDYLLPRNSTQNSIESQQSYLINEVTNLKNIEDSNLFLLTVQCLTTNDILKKYSQELRNVAQKQAQENRTLKDEISQLKEDSIFNEMQNKSTTIKERDLEPLNTNDPFRVKIHRLLLRCRDILQEQIDGLEFDTNKQQKANSSLNEEESEIIDLSSLNELIKIVGGGQNLPDNEQYVMKLEKKVESQKQRFSDAINRYDQMIQELKEEITKSQEEFNQINEQNQTRITADAQTILENEEKIQQLEKENEELRTDLSAARNEVQRLAENSKSDFDEISSNYNDIRSDFNELLEHLHEKLVEFSNESREQFSQAKHLIKKYLYSMNYANQEVKKAVIEVVSQKDNQIRKLERALQQIQTRLEETEEEKEKFKDELKQEKQKNIQNSVKIRTLELKQKSQEESMQRDLSLKQKQIEFQARSREAEAEQKIERIKMETNRQIHEICTKICRNFKEFVDITQPISVETVEKVMIRVNDRLLEAKEDKMMKEDLVSQMNTLKRLLNVKEGQQNMRISSLLTDYIHSTNLQLNKLDRLQQENDRMRAEITEARKTNNMSLKVKEWENWAKKVSQIAFDTQEYAKDNSLLRRKLEEIILHSTNITVTQRKVEMLRIEKKILENGINQVQKTKFVKLKAPIMAIVSIALMQRMCGCIHTDLGGIGLDLSDDSEDNITSSSFNDSFQSKPPLFSNFVIPSK